MDKELVLFIVFFEGSMLFIVALLWAMAREAGTSGGSSYG
jgi:hypothetical protein